MNVERNRLRTLASKRIEGVPVEKIPDALVEVDAADVLVALGDKASNDADELLRVSLIRGSSNANGRPVAVRPDHLLKLLGPATSGEVEVPQLVEG